MTISGDQAHVTGPGGDTEDSILNLAHGDIHLCQDGPRDAPALLLIHGTASSARSWEQMVPLLAKSHRVIRIDLLGHGRSAKPGGRGYEIPEQGRQVGVVLDRLGVRECIVVGHSSGGTVATALAEQRPDLVTAIALIDTGPSMDAFIGPDAGIGFSQWPPADEQIRQLASSGFSRPGFEVPEEFLDDVRGMTLEAFIAIMQAPREYLEQQALPDRLKELGKPLQVIFGDQDRRWRPSSAGDYQVVPGARVEWLPGVGHTPILEDPQRTAALLLAFTGLVIEA
ncbi:MAG: alpha/beta hydrolase [Nocardiopsaceae bacterium]|nr:alpha/beta hydrolase [Nocardiopsaceae bacterium]